MHCSDLSLTSKLMHFKAYALCILLLVENMLFYCYWVNPFLLGISNWYNIYYQIIFYTLPKYSWLPYWMCVYLVSMSLSLRESPTNTSSSSTFHFSLTYPFQLYWFKPKIIHGLLSLPTDREIQVLTFIYYLYFFLYHLRFISISISCLYFWKNESYCWSLQFNI